MLQMMVTVETGHQEMIKFLVTVESKYVERLEIVNNFYMQV